MANASRNATCKIALVGTLLILAVCLAGCGANSQQSSGSASASASSPASATQLALENCAVMRDDSFGGIYVDITIDEFKKTELRVADVTAAERVPKVRMRLLQLDVTPLLHLTSSIMIFWTQQGRASI